MLKYDADLPVDVMSVHVFKYCTMQVFDKLYINPNRYRVLERLFQNVVRNSEHFV